MMTEHNDGGAAFPSDVRMGMTLRDYFADGADGFHDETTMDHAAACVEMEPLFGAEKTPAAATRWWAEATARFKYIAADAMLAERARREEQAQ